MDIYQIFITYNRMWSWREIVCFSIVVLVAFLLLYRAVRDGRIQMVQAIAFMLLLAFLGIVFESTVFTRTTIRRQAELVPFWSWKAIIRYHDRELLKEDLLNCILLLPVGVLLPFVRNKVTKARDAFVAGFLISLCIETSQLILARGLFEWDDMIHNAFGCMVGCILVNQLFRCYQTLKVKRQKNVGSKNSHESITDSKMIQQYHNNNTIK